MYPSRRKRMTEKIERMQGTMTPKNVVSPCCFFGFWLSGSAPE